MNLTHLSLCSGIGGLDLAAEWAGFKTVAQCEIDEYASKVLAKHFSGVPNLHDIRTVTNKRLADYGINAAEITVVSAGFPCQPYSLAGKGRGDSDERDLWGEVARVIGELKPRWFVGENTPGLFARENQRYFRRILNDLAALGYSVGWGIWGAVDVGAPHKRDRVFIVAHSNGERRGVLGERERKAFGALDNAKAEAPCGAGGVYGNFFNSRCQRRNENGTAEQCACKTLAKEVWWDESCGADSVCRDISNTDGLRERQPQGVEQESGGRFGNVCENISDSAGDKPGVFGRKKKTAGIASRRGNIRNGAQANVGGEWWQTEPDVGRVANGVPARVDRLRCLGNAVVPYQALPIFEAIANEEKRLEKVQL